MNRLAVKDIFLGTIVQKENELNEVEQGIDLTDNQVVCDDDSCGLIWKPLPNNIPRDESSKS